LLEWTAMKALFGLSVLASGLGVFGADARTAEACSPPQCWAGFFTPGNATTVPANLAAFHWRPMQGFTGDTTDPSKVSLATAAGTPVPITASELPNGDWVFTIDAPLAEGTAYVLRDLNVCAGDQIGPTAMFTAAASAPLPTELGTLAVTDHLLDTLEVGTSSGSCSIGIEADQVLVDLALAPSAMPWRDVLMFETLVDGQSWRPSAAINGSVAPGTSWQGRGTDRVYATCSSPDPNASPGLAVGPHEVTMRATLPGTTTPVTATSVAVALTCANEPPDECSGALLPHGGCDDGDDHGGCNAGGETSLLGLALVGLVMRRRKRR
jgi:uncharacterized protein (TIGR03382 family)